MEVNSRGDVWGRLFGDERDYIELLLRAAGADETRKLSGRAANLFGARSDFGNLDLVGLDGYRSDGRRATLRFADGTAVTVEAAAHGALATLEGVLARRPRLVELVPAGPLTWALRFETDDSARTDLGVWSMEVSALAITTGPALT